MTTEEEARRDARRGQQGGIFATHTDDGLELCPRCNQLGVILPKATVCMECEGTAPKAAWLWL